MLSTTALFLVVSSMPDVPSRGARTVEVALSKPVPDWGPATASRADVRDLHREYGNVFKVGNRNAASHLWSSFILERAPTMTHERFELMASGYCAISGSPVTPSDYTRYQLTLPLVSGKGSRTGYMYYCCWPCVCDTQDFIRVDTKNVTTASGTRRYHFAVIGNPCSKPEMLRAPFTQPFYNRGETTLEREAPEVRCEEGVLRGATMSDHGYVILALFFDADQQPTTPPAGALPSGGEGDADAAAEGAAEAAPSARSIGDYTALADPKPGRMSVSSAGLNFQHEGEYAPMCTDRARNGYNSGMGEIFRRVAAISPVAIPDAAVLPAAACDADGHAESA